MDSRTDIMSSNMTRKKIEKVSLFAVVVDFSESHTTELNQKRTMFKVIDETFNKTCSPI